jgi:hypothetical protein
LAALAFDAMRFAYCALRGVHNGAFVALSDGYSKVSGD